MDQIKIGKFISLKRKEKNITQSKLAESLGITDRAISKWENGICLPDASIMKDLCKILGITINDLFSGEVVDMKENEKKLEENLLEMTKIKEQQDRHLLNLEIFIGLISTILFTGSVLLIELVEMHIAIKIVIGVLTGIIFLISLSLAIKIEQVAGYYECQKCHHKYVPTYKSVFLAMHLSRTRYLKCPHCGNKSWHKKVIK